MALKASSETNPFQIRKAEDLEEAQIQSLFVEPNPDFLKSLLAERTHRVLQGGRGAGKTITLRKLGATLSAPGPAFPFLGIYLSLDVTQFAPFDESRLGTSGAWLFECYFAGIIVQELLRTLTQTQFGFRTSIESFCERASRVLSYDLQPPIRTLSALTSAVTDAAEALLGDVSRALGSLRSSDVKILFTLYKLREITDIIADEIFVFGTKVTTVLLLDRYDDLSRSQQVIANALCNLPPPRTMYIIAGVAPLGLTTLDLGNGQRLQEYQHYRTVSIEKSIRFDDYATLANTVASKYLVAGRPPHSNLRTSLSRLLEESPTFPYSGLASFAHLSDFIIAII